MAALLSFFFCAAFLVPSAIGATVRTPPQRHARAKSSTPNRGSNRPGKGTLLVASDTLADPNFAESVVLLLTYDDRGAVGVVINRPTSLRLAEMLPKVAALHDRPDRAFLGGPVLMTHMMLLVRSAHRPHPADHIFENVYAAGSLDAVQEVFGRRVKGEGIRAYLGHAGWGPAQLDREIARGDWHVAAGDAAAVFDMDPEDIWPNLAKRFSGEWTRRDPGPDPASTPSLRVVGTTTARIISARPRQTARRAFKHKSPLPVGDGARAA